jgi:ABC-type branched-subunit amino acid transport system substrate-binding protein
MRMDRRAFMKTGLGGAAALATPSLLRPALAADTIDVGVLFSLTGGLSIIEKSLHDATLMAISEINASGGVMGKPVNAIVEDGASDPKTYNEKASKLVIEDKLPTVFGSYTSTPPITKASSARRTSSTPAPFPTSSSPTSSRGSSRRSARRRSSSSAPTTSIRARWPRSARS